MDTVKVIRFPVHCPVCQAESSFALRQSEILTALDNEAPIQVYASCHDKSWNLDASAREKLSTMAKSA